MTAPDPLDPGLLTPAETSLLTDQYEISMAMSYFLHGMDEPAVFELFVRHLPAHRDWTARASPRGTRCLGPSITVLGLAVIGRPAARTRVRPARACE